MLKKLIQVAIMASAVWAFNAHGQAPNIVLTIDGVRGEISAGPYADQIAVQSFSWGLGNDASFQGGGVSDPQANFRDLEIFKSVDSSSPVLYQAIAEGGGFSNERAASLRFISYSAPDNEAHEVLVITMQKVRVTSASFSDTDTLRGSGDLNEVITLAFASYCVEYTSRDSSPPEPIRTCWDIEGNTRL